MKKFYLLLFIICLFPFFIVGCSKEQLLNEYQISVKYDQTTQTATCFQKVKYFNNSENAFDVLPFNLYANAFLQENQNSVVMKSDFEKAYPNGESFGGIGLIAVEIDGSECEFLFEEQKNILVCPLSTTLYPNQFVEIEMSYILTLPNINHRFGFGDNTINFGNFYPVVCAYKDKEGFIKHKYDAKGDPFCFETSNFEVNFECANDFKLASSGEICSKISNHEKTNYKIIGKNLRDFVVILSSNFKILNKNVNGVELNYFYINDNNASQTFKAAEKSFLFFCKEFGDYPYNNLNIVQADFLHGGMEFSNVALISEGLKHEIDLQYVAVHEIAHQWWFGAVGNNQFEESWIDESLAEFSTALFFKNNPEFSIDYNTLITNAKSSFNQFKQVYSNIFDNVNLSMTRSLDEFATSPEYSQCVYTQGLLMWDTVLQECGEKKVLDCFKKFFNEFCFKIAEKDDLIYCIEKKCGSKSGKIVNSFLSGKAIMF